MPIWHFKYSMGRPADATVGFHRTRGSNVVQRVALSTRGVDLSLQARVDDFAKRHSRGDLTPEEQAEYGAYVQFDTYIAILKSKARQRLATGGHE
jgi:hypothetical protein